jgi:hypothetical protein
MPNFLLYNIRQNPRATPDQIYNLFHRKIQEQEFNQLQILRKALDIIDRNIREINLVTEDPEKQLKINLQTDILRKVEREIRESYINPGSEFLSALETLIKYTPEN